jgi:hypothetical protein
VGYVRRRRGCAVRNPDAEPAGDLVNRQFVASDGTPVRYLQLAHNEWDAATKTSRPKVLYSFGREDQLDRVVIERLVASLCRPLEPVRRWPRPPRPA